MKVRISAVGDDSEAKRSNERLKNVMRMARLLFISAIGMLGKPLSFMQIYSCH